MERDFFIIVRIPFMLVTFFFVLTVFLGITIWFWLKGDSNMIKKLPIISAAVHFILIVVFSIIVLVWMRYDEEAPIAWITFFPLDWPVSIFIKSEKIFGMWAFIFKAPFIKNIPFIIFDGIVEPLISFGLFGTIQYYIWGIIVSKILLFLKK